MVFFNPRKLFINLSLENIRKLTVQGKVEEEQNKSKTVFHVFFDVQGRADLAC